MIFILVLAYPFALVVSLARWRGLRMTIRKHAQPLAFLCIGAILFVFLGGVEVSLGLIGFALFMALIVAMIAGPLGFFVGLFVGFGVGICALLSQLVPGV